MEQDKAREGRQDEAVEQAHSIFYILQQYSNLTRYNGEGRGLVRLVGLFLERRTMGENKRRYYYQPRKGMYIYYSIT